MASKLCSEDPCSKDVYGKDAISKVLDILLFIPSFFFLRFYLFLERGREEEGKGEKHLHAPLLVTWPITQACALTGNQTGDSLVRRLALSPLSHTNQDYPFIFDF